MSSELVSSFIVAVVGIIVVICGFLAVRTLQTIDANQKTMADTMAASFKDLYEKYNALNTIVHELHGEHAVNHERRKHPRIEWPK